MSHRHQVLSILACLSAGCANKVTIVSSPLGAVVRMDGDVVGSTPVDVTVYSVPFTRPTAHVTLPGYRRGVADLTVDRRPVRRLWELVTFRWRKGLGLDPTSWHEVLLVERRGPVETWPQE